MRTGYRHLDAQIGETTSGEVVILGGRTGTGRSSLALDIALYAAQRGEAVAFFSFETKEARVMRQVASKLSSVPLSDTRTGDATCLQWIRIGHSASSPIWSRLHVTGSANLTVTQIRDRVREISADRESKGENRVSLVVVDPLRLMGPVSPLSEAQRRHHLAENVVQFKQMARELSLAVLLVSDVHLRAYDAIDKPPELSDLEPLEVVESYADKVLLLHRDVSSNGSDYQGEPQVIIAKRRKGATG